MNRIDRVTAILIQLQSKRVVKAQEIADRFNISLRTVYRDIKTLDEAGIPVVGEAGLGYSIMDGYRLPPVMFTKEEATAFLTAEKLVEKLTDGSTKDDYKAAMFKVKAVLRLTEKDHLETMYEHIEVMDNPYLPKLKNESTHLQSILAAIATKNAINISYVSEAEQKETNRNVEPIGIFYLGRYWYLIAYCLLRKDYRHFKVNCIKKLMITALPIEKQHPSLQSFLKKTSEEKELHTIIIRLEKDILKYFGEQKFYNGFVSQEEVNGKVEMTFLTSSLTGFARWFMLFGDQVEIVTPAVLKELVLEHLTNIQNNLK